MMAQSYPKVAQLKTVEAFRERLSELGLDLPVDDTILSREQGSPLADPIAIGPHTAGNRWCIHPMEGWDAHRDGSPSAHTLRRWRNFGLSGAKLIWGGEAAAVHPAGRANPNQTLATSENREGLLALKNELLQTHLEKFGTADDLVIGLQLTHSGRYCKPNSDQAEPRIAYHHPLLDEKCGIDPTDADVLISDDEIEQLIDCYVTAARLARDVGFHFVDVKACHGYLLHEFLSARHRPGKFGGDFNGRTRLLCTIVERIIVEVGLTVVVRLSVFDVPPFRTSRDIGQPMDYEKWLPYEFGFGLNQENPFEIDLEEPLQLIENLKDLGVAAVNISCGSPYYNPHIQRPAIFPPSDGYLPPEDPLVGVSRQIHAARQCKQTFPDLPMVGSGYSYLQDYLPHVAQAAVRNGWIDIVGLGRMVLSYPELPDDTLAGRELKRKQVCRTFSDCTTAPRSGIISGCFPLDDYYKCLPESVKLKQVKQQQKQSAG